MILRGVNYNSLGDYWQGNANVATTKTYTPDDIRMMSSYGFNCIRLLFSWSKLEPERGKYNYDYIRQLKEVIEEAAKYNIYILLDMHRMPGANISSHQETWYATNPTGAGMALPTGPRLRMGSPPVQPMAQGNLHRRFIMRFRIFGIIQMEFRMRA